MGKIMGALGSLLLAIYVGDLLFRVELYGLGLGWAAWLLIHATPQHVGRDGVFSGQLRC